MKLAEKTSHDPGVVLSGIHLIFKKLFFAEDCKVFVSGLPQIQKLAEMFEPVKPSNISYSFSHMVYNCLFWHKNSKEAHFHCVFLVSGFRNISAEYFLSHLSCFANKSG